MSEPEKMAKKLECVLYDPASGAPLTFSDRVVMLKEAAALIRRLQAENEALRVKQAGLVEALKQIRDETRGCSQDMGFCRENGPLGCALGDQCVCMPVHMIARAAIEEVNRE